jgi:hypothetical protein
MATPPYTVLDLITRAMRLLRVLNIGTPPNAAEEQDGLEALNAMTDDWAIQRLLIYTTARLVFGLNAGQPSYEIGPNADPDLGWVAQRPVYIEGAGLIYAAGGTPVELPVHVMTLKEWRNVRTKSLETGGQILTDIYYDSGFTNPDGSTTGLDGAGDTGSGVVWVYPIVTATGEIALYLPQAVSQFSSINQTVALPPGYRRALAYNLAVEFASEFDVEPSDVVIAIAQESKANLKRANVHLDKLSCDPALTQGRRRGFNIYSGE